MFEYLERNEYAQDVYFVILLASVGTFLERDNKERDISNNLVRLINNQREKGEGLPAISMITSALWFSDYRGYQNAVKTKINELMEMGFYNE